MVTIKIGGDDDLKGKIDGGIVDWYVDIGIGLFPLNMKPYRVDGTASIRAQGKIPYHRLEWRNAKFGRTKLLKLAEQGFNLGCALPSDMFVIDVDPRNGGVESLHAMLNDCGIGFSDFEDCAAFVVCTGGDVNGRHYYFHKRDDENLPTKLKKYPGIDIKREGGYVIAPGSWHFEGQRYYKVSEDVESLPSQLTPAPEALMELLTTVHDDEVGRSATSDGSPGFSNDEIARCLDLLNPADYTSYDSWRDLVYSCHFTSNGDAIEAVADFCKKMDVAPSKKSRRELISLWNSCRSDKAKPLTQKYLYKQLKGKIPADIDMKYKRAKLLSYLDVEAVSDTERFESTLRSEKATAEEKSNASSQKAFSILMEAIEAIDETGLPDDILGALAPMVSQFIGTVTYEKVVASISKKLKMTVTSLNRYFGGCVEASEIDNRKKVARKISKQCEMIVETLLATNSAVAKFAALVVVEYRGMFVVDSTGRLLVFNGTHWATFEKRLIMHQFINTQSADAYSGNRSVSGFVDDVYNMLHGVVKDKVDISSLRSDPSRPDIFNFVGREVHIDRATGAGKVYKNNMPESYQDYVLDYAYERGAECPVFDNFLEQSFGHLQDSEDVIRHLWELIGATMSYYKSLPVFVMFLGDGSNGKSIIIKMLQSLLGERAVSLKFKDFDPKYQHAYTPFVGKLAALDDDMKVSGELSDHIIKTFASDVGMKITVNPKRSESFTTDLVCYAWACCNRPPMIKDANKSIARRVHIFKFERVLDDKDVDTELLHKINRELSGIFNKAARALMRLRERNSKKGCSMFSIPKSLKRWTREWAEDTKPIMSFLKFLEDEKPFMNARMDLKKFAAYYAGWQADNGYKKLPTLNTVRMMIREHISSGERRISLINQDRRIEVSSTCVDTERLDRILSDKNGWVSWEDIVKETSNNDGIYGIYDEGYTINTIRELTDDGYIESTIQGRRILKLRKCDF